MIQWIAENLLFPEGVVEQDLVSPAFCSDNIGVVPEALHLRQHGDAREFVRGDIQVFLVHGFSACAIQNGIRPDNECLLCLNNCDPVCRIEGRDGLSVGFCVGISGNSCVDENDCEKRAYLYHCFHVDNQRSFCSALSGSKCLLPAKNKRE